jgi:HPt (histidine-containing phosphotransfer) domain-containing protein
MAQPAVKSIEEGAGTGEAIDRAHLARMTFGDSGLERELLELFDRQAVILLERMRAADAASVAALAHTLKGSALGVGATAVAQAAAAAERAATASAIDGLQAAVEEARLCIAGILRGLSSGV